ncbi:MAG: HEAT repeat domain-containing protein [Elusimicrobia bacterium]|nr:HEAT repeat domain-containing protein [Elusimicrobiota bacterium]
MRHWRLAVPAVAALALGGCLGELPTLPQIQTGNPPLATPGGPTPIKTDAQITNALVDLVEAKRQFKVDVSQFQPGTPEGDLINLGSPIGYQLRTRYLSLGIPLAEALSRNADPVFRERLMNLARWDADGETRAAALVALAGTHDAVHYDVFREALIHLDPAVRFGALEALLIWDHPERSMPLLTQVAESDSEPILRVYAAGGLARLQDPAGLLRLRAYLDHSSWLVRAMAAQYLGDYGGAEDYDLLVSRIGRETVNDFVVAEYCIAALKLFPKKEPPPPPPPATEAPHPTVDLAAFQLEPLVVVAHRVKIQNQLAIDPQINAHLMRLLQQRMDARPDSQAALDASIGNLSRLSTATGYKLKTRYTELGFLLTEGLAGVTDMQMDSELEKVSRLGTNVQTRAAAMVALAFTHDLRYLPLFQGAIVAPNITTRFGALESLLTLQNPAVQFQVGNAARVDASLLVQVYAASGMWHMGDIFGREILLNLAQNQDWLVRSMAIRYLGEQGGSYEYTKIMQWFSMESNQMVKAEMCSALLNLQKFNTP